MVGYIPEGLKREEAAEFARDDPGELSETVPGVDRQTCARHVDLQKLGAITFDYGNNIRTFAYQQGVKNAYDFPGFVPAYIRPLFCEGRGPLVGGTFGRPSDIHRTDKLVLEIFPQTKC